MHRGRLVAQDDEPRRNDRPHRKAHNARLVDRRSVHGKLQISRRDVLDIDLPRLHADQPRGKVLRKTERRIQPRDNEVHRFERLQDHRLVDDSVHFHDGTARKAYERVRPDEAYAFGKILTPRGQVDLFGTHHVEVLHHAEERLGAPIRQGYGMTETSPGTHQVADADFTTSPAGCVGTLLPNTEARLVDPESHDDVEPGVPGELLIRGPQVMDGYLDNAEATAETLTDGWLHTGDLVRVDDDGRFWVVDRLKELIKYKGYQIAPAELESILLTHPMVADVAVIGIPHHEGGEAPKAFVVAREPVDEAELMSFVAARVTPYKKVRQVQFVDAIPKSPTGKILRRVLKAGNHGHGARRPAEEPARGSAI